MQITPQDCKRDPEVSLKLDDLYARLWETDYERSTFDAENHNASPLKTPEIAMRCDLPTDETWNTLETSGERSPESFPPTEELCDHKRNVALHGT